MPYLHRATGNGVTYGIRSTMEAMPQPKDMGHLKCPPPKDQANP